MDDFNTDFAKELFQLGIDLNTPGPQVPIDLERDLELSIQMDVVALALARCAWLMVGKPVGVLEPLWAEFSPELRERYRGLAERAIQTIDPAVRIEAKDEAATETDDWFNGPGNMGCDAPTVEQIAHEAISRYESKLASLRIEGDE